MKCCWIWEISDISSGTAVPAAGEQVLLITSGTKIKQPYVSSLRLNARACLRACMRVWVHVFHLTSFNVPDFLLWDLMAAHSSAISTLQRFTSSCFTVPHLHLSPLTGLITELFQSPPLYFYYSYTLWHNPSAPAECCPPLKSADEELFFKI